MSTFGSAKFSYTELLYNDYIGLKHVSYFIKQLKKSQPQWGLLFCLNSCFKILNFTLVYILITNLMH